MFHYYTPCLLKLSSLSMLNSLSMLSKLSTRIPIQYLKPTFFHTSNHAASGNTNSPHENPEEYKNEIPMDFIFIFFLDET